MRKYEVKNIIFSSTGGALMGRPDKLPVSESTAPNPISPYGASKMACEGYLSAYADSFDIHSIALRFGNVVGPYSGHKKGVVNKWVELLLQNRDIVIYGDGSSTRDYISVDDICQGLRLSLDAILGENLDNKFEVFHLSNNHQVSLSDLFLMLKDITQSTSSVVYMPSRQGEVINNCATYAKAHDLLGFRPSKSLEVCLSQYVDWVKNS